MALEGELRRNHPEIAVSRQSFEKWSRLHHWVKRVRAHDKSVAAAPPPQPGLILDPNFDQIDALLQAANQALTRAMNAAPVVSKPSDAKALVDAAANALKVMETIKSQSRGKVSREEMARALNLIEQARMRDVEEMVEAELKRRRVGAAADGRIPAPAAAAELDAPTRSRKPPSSSRGQNCSQTWRRHSLDPSFALDPDLELPLLPRSFGGHRRPTMADVFTSKRDPAARRSLRSKPGYAVWDRDLRGG